MQSAVLAMIDSVRLTVWPSDRLTVWPTDDVTLQPEYILCRHGGFVGRCPKMCALSPPPKKNTILAAIILRYA